MSDLSILEQVQGSEAHSAKDESSSTAMSRSISPKTTGENTLPANGTQEDVSAVKPKRQYRKSAATTASGTLKKTKKQQKLEEMVELEKELEIVSQENGKLKSVIFKIRQEIELYSQYMTKYSLESSSSVKGTHANTTKTRGPRAKSTTSSKQATATRKKKKTSVSPANKSTPTTKKSLFKKPMGASVLSEKMAMSVSEPARVVKEIELSEYIQSQQQQQQQHRHQGVSQDVSMTRADSDLMQLDDILIDTSMYASPARDGAMPTPTKRRRIRKQQDQCPQNVNSMLDGLHTTSSTNFLDNVLSIDNALLSTTTNTSTHTTNNTKEETKTALKKTPSRRGRKPKAAKATQPAKSFSETEDNSISALPFMHTDETLDISSLPVSPSSLFALPGLVDGSRFSPVPLLSATAGHTNPLSHTPSKPTSNDISSTGVENMVLNDFATANNTLPTTTEAANLEPEDIMLMNTLKDVLSHM